MQVNVVVSGNMDLSRDELSRLDVTTLVEIVLELRRVNAAFEQRVTALEARLNQNSRNSSKPPSSDSQFQRMETPPKKGAKRSGGQAGHKGHGLSKVAIPDHIARHAPERCNGCGHEFDSTTLSSAEVCGSWQVFDLPAELRIEITEHRRLALPCPRCRQRAQGSLPPHLSQTTPCQWGVRSRALAVYLMQGQHLPFERTQSLFIDLFGSAPSEGTLFNWLQEAHSTLEPVEKAIAEALVQSEAIGADETTARGAGWLHTVVNDQYTWYGCHEKRGRLAIESFGLLPRFNGLLMSDCLGSYNIYGKDRSLCNAHLLRDLTAVWESGHDWPELMMTLLLRAKGQVEEQDKPLSRSSLASIYRQYGKILAAAHREESARTVPKAKALITRMRDKRDEYLRFASRAGAWFDNNRSERALRMTKLHVKISGCFRSVLGCEILCRVRGYLSTMSKQGQPLLSALRSVMERSPLYPPMLPATA